MNIDNVSDYEASVQEHIEDLKGLINNHNSNAKYANTYKIIFNSLNYFLSASTALSLTIITLLVPNDQLLTTLIGAIFAFFVAIVTKLRDNYKYDELCLRHESASMDYYKLKQKFSLLLITNNQTTEKMLVLVELLNELKEKYHLENLPCNDGCCC